MNTITRWDQSRGLASLQDQVNRLFEDNFTRDRSGPAELATWAPARGHIRNRERIGRKGRPAGSPRQGH